jgi:hypothetical protein
MLTVPLDQPRCTMSSPTASAALGFALRFDTPSVHEYPAGSKSNVSRGSRVLSLDSIWVSVRRHMLWLVAALALLVAAPSVSADFYSDDQGMVLAMDGIAPPMIPGPFHLYTFMTGAPGERDALVRDSQVPWWTVDGIRLSFCRPLSSALLALDHALAGRDPLPYHLHSMAWYAAAAVAAGALFRRLLPEREALTAAVLFAIAPAHWMLASWPSARHVAISGTLSIAALLAHWEARNRPEASRLWPLLALGLGALALAGGETGLGVFGYVAAYELLGRRDPLARRLRALAPWAALFFAYALLYKGLGFGVRGAGAYLDPIAQPLAYLTAMPTRLAVYASAALLCIPSELTVIAPSSVPLLSALGVGAVLTLTWLWSRALRALPPNQARTLAWLLVGALLAVLPGLASIPGDRVLFLSNLGIVAVLSIVLQHAWAKGERGLGVWLSRLGVVVFGFVHLALAPLSFAFGAWQLAVTSHAALAAASQAEIPARPGLTVVGIGLADPLVGMYLASALYIAPRPEPRPRSVYLLSMSAHRHRVRRVDERTLEITLLGGTLLDEALEYLFRARSSPLRAGDVTPLGAFSVRVLEEDAGRPTRFSVLFDRSLEDPSLSFVIWKRGGLRAFALPQAGQEVLVEHELGPMGI